MKYALLSAALMALPATAFAHEGIAIKDAFARVTNAMSGGVFMTIDNAGAHDCTLSGASSDAAEQVMLHTSKEVDGVMKMMHLEDGLLIEAGGARSLARGGDHIMLMGLTDALEDGQSIEVTVDFGDCGKETIDVPVDNKR